MIIRYLSLVAAEVIKVKGLELIDFATVSKLAHYHSATAVALSDWSEGNRALSEVPYTRCGNGNLLVLARMKAEAELAALYREREIARAKATQRDITQPLN